MSKTIHFSEWAEKVHMFRIFRRLGGSNPEPFEYDPEPPPHFTPNQVERCLKIVAHWEGGPDPDDPAAVPVTLKLKPEGAK